MSPIRRLNEMMNLPDRFIQYIKKENLFQPSDTLLLAVSGGLDSVVLAELCHLCSYRFVIAHCNFGLRDKESERDKEFVSALAEKYDVDFLLKEFETQKFAAANKLSIQEAARKLRYDWFNELVTKNSIKEGLSRTIQKPPTTNIESQTTHPTIANYTLTAHHADDNIETMLMNFFRGTGIQGIRGMLPKQGKIIRPLLLFRKQQLLEFANSRALTWVEDSSNQSDKYSRNYFRKNVIPLIQQIYPEVEQNLLNNLQRFRDIEVLYRESVDRHKQKLLEQKGNEIHIPVLKLRKTQPLITTVHEIISDYGFTAGQVQEIINLMESETGKYVQSSTHRIIKNRNWLIIAPKANELAGNIIIEESDSMLHFAMGELYIDTSTYAQCKLQTTNHIAQLNAAEIKFPLLLRKWKPGDYFYPLGMKKKKKLSRFFIDQKLSKADKENIWVIEMNKKIIWVVGMRIDERFKITHPAMPVLSITLKRQ